MLDTIEPHFSDLSGLSHPSDKEIRRIIKSELCRKSFYEFAKEFWKVIEPGTEFIDAWYFKAICDHLQAVHDGLFKNLIICIPPGFAKSTSVSVLWPAWTWIDGPEIRMMVGSYDEELTFRDSVKCRDIVNSKRYQRLFHPRWRIKSDVNSKGYFSNTMHGGRRTYYMRSSHKTGWRCQYMIVDDPLSAEHRYDRNIKMQAIDTWDNVLWSRVNRSKRHAFIVIMQRLADDDLVGHILEKYGQDYVQLILPNEFDPKTRCVTPIFTDPRTEEGELLCPELLSTEKTAEAKLRLGPVDYSAQYQHRPVPAGGDRFKSEHFQYWRYTNSPYLIEIRHRKALSENEKTPLRVDRLTQFLSADTAIEEKTKSDFSVIGRWAITDKNEIILLHRMKFKEDEPGIIAKLKEFYGMAQWGRVPPACVYVEKNGVGGPICQLARSVGLPIKEVHVSKDPRARTAIAVTRMEGGQIFLPDYDIAPWMYETVQELLSYPAGAHDDEVSMISIAANSIFEQAVTSPRSVSTIPDKNKPAPINPNKTNIDLANTTLFGVKSSDQNRMVNGGHPPVKNFKNFNGNGHDGGRRGT